MQAKKSITLSGAIAVVNSIKTSIATVAGAASYSGAGLNGSIGTAVMTVPQNIKVTLASHAGSYTNGSTITLTGLDPTGGAQVEVLTIVGTDGGTTLTGAKFFSKLNQIDIQAQFDTGGAFQFGTQDALFSSDQLRVGVAGNLSVKYGDGSLDTIVAVQIGEQVPATVSIVFGTSTAQSVTGYLTR